jgi:ribosomal protein S24E
MKNRRARGDGGIDLPSSLSDWRQVIHQNVHVDTKKEAREELQKILGKKNEHVKPDRSQSHYGSNTGWTQAHPRKDRRAQK